MNHELSEWSENFLPAICDGETGHRQRRLKELQGFDWINIVSWNGALIFCFGFWFGVYHLTLWICRLVEAVVRASL